MWWIVSLFKMCNMGTVIGVSAYDERQHAVFYKFTESNVGVLDWVLECAGVLDWVLERAKGRKHETTPKKNTVAKTLQKPVGRTAWKHRAHLR